MSDDEVCGTEDDELAEKREDRDLGFGAVVASETLAIDVSRIHDTKPRG